MAQINERQKAWAITREELNLRFDLKEGKISLEEFYKRYEKLLRQGKIVRNGKMMK